MYLWRNFFLDAAYYSLLVSAMLAFILGMMYKQSTYLMFNVSSIYLLSRSDQLSATKFHLLYHIQYIYSIQIYNKIVVKMFLLFLYRNTHMLNYISFTLSFSFIFFLARFVLLFYTLILCLSHFCLPSSFFIYISLSLCLCLCDVVA